MTQYAKTLYVLNKESNKILLKRASFCVHIKINADMKIVLGLASDDISDVEWVYFPSKNDLVELKDFYEVN